MIADDDGGQWVSIGTAGRMLGLSRQAIQQRIKRDKIEHRTDNRGNPIVRVAGASPPSVAGASKNTSPESRPQQSLLAQATTGAESATLVLGHRGQASASNEANNRVPVELHLEMIRSLQGATTSALEAAETRRLSDLADRDRLHAESVAATKADNLAAQERADRLHAESVAAIRADHTAMVSVLIERIDGAECRAEAAEARAAAVEDKLTVLLERVTTPWWVRLLEAWRGR